MKALGWTAILCSQLLVILGFWFWNHWHSPMGNQLAGETSDQLLAYGRLAGLLAAFGILFQIILIGRVKWVERAFGLDRLTRLHHVVGFALITMLLAHPALVTAGHAMRADVPQWEQTLDFWRNWEDVLAASIGLAVFLGAILLSVAIIRRRMPYEAWHLTHLSIYIAIALAFGHQLSVGSDFTDNKWFAAYWRGLYVFTFGNLVYYRMFRPFWLYFRHRFRVSELLRESSDVTSVHIGGRHMDRFAVKAGQFMSVRFLAPGFRWQTHPFSVSCRPDGKHVRLTIKAVGDYTKRVPELKPGMPVIIDGPHGVFTADRCVSSKVLLIAGGIGVTPIRSVAEDLLAAGREVILLYNNRDRRSIVFERELEELAAAGRMRIVHILSADPEWQGEKGRIDKEKILRLVPDVLEREVYLCGPPPMMKSLRAIFREIGLPGGKLHHERFAL